ncbi:hypothetical protein AN214_00655 [Pseudoalteromonas sp. P1-9]|nr:hypothetical protein AN214_00655 [Pseudoalteromonas sp. P1-9]
MVGKIRTPKLCKVLDLTNFGADTSYADSML